MPELAEGTLVDDRYRIICRLGSGGMADVYCASDEQLGRKVAVKLLYPRFAEDHEFVERFRREASSAAGLQHPHVVSVFDRGEWDGTYYIAMEYLEGRSLKSLVNLEAPLDPVRAIDLVIQILTAARFAHQRGIIHRDLKPHNVIVDHEARVKVTDFGIARAGASDVTQTGSIMGTAQYLSPEQAQGHAVSAASDLYSIGIVLYELLTGRVPFEGPNAVTIALKQVSESPLAPSALNPAVTPDLDAIVLRALEKDPARRYPDADTFIAALEHARAGLLAPVGGSTAQFAAVTAEPTVLAAPAAAYEEYPAPVAVPVEGRRWPWVVVVLLLLAALALVAFLLAPTSKRRVPDVRNQPQSRATAALRHAGFRIRQPVRHSLSASVRGGRVITTSPGPRANVSSGSAVTLYVSSGPAPVVVPHLVGAGRLAATRQLRQLNLRVREKNVTSDAVPPHHVVSVSPPAGTRLHVGRTVTLTVSQAKQTTQVPSVVGRQVLEARSVLGAAGFAIATVQKISDQQPGTVLDQTPGANTNARRGSTVSLTVAKRSDKVAVTDVLSQAEGDARTNLAADGFKIRTVHQPVTGADRDGKVIAQNPSPGRQVKRGATVTITVGRLAGGSGTTGPGR